ncbi:UDP-N-acetylmuramoyl-L-alanine--D-glutamate ligase [Fulvimarina sp. 2208YS6-2-32]|uniref:UDP-N-acetylmuramoylalanine--D-glutamate ligase n=1 Tax=Fulvimarina uroteuthidis TaxID=3098149 RepID=A0ABU5I5T5_9HYPH|nr:UDP-N-acetylmuramoyl-L-alanine--D-glutamate ligase [Fulvimarina sp. 2208YS6-2-32]MDY8110758.1 UDP-N-acetylmuramoyl-L-alanine--D-glutamate ligase [Fulvimarina sp. 2208YS6-2-32]
MKIESFAGKRIALFGLGGSGLATAQALLEGGADLVAFDDNPESVAKADAAGIATGNLHEIDWSRLDGFVLSPGVPLTHPKPHWSVDLAARAGVPVIGDVEIFGRERRMKAPESPFVAITGTNGKSTTTALIAHCLAQSARNTQLGGNIGVPVLTLADPSPQNHYVVECSSYQIDLAPTLQPSVGLLLNLTPDHLDRHGTMEHYAAVKERLVAGADHAVVGDDDEWCRAIGNRLEGAGRRVVRISGRGPVENGAFYEDGAVLRRMEGYPEARFDLGAIGSLRGRHNGQNAAAAVAVLTLCGLIERDIANGLKSFPGLAHRMEEVGRIGNALFINDSKATNADAAGTALASFERIYWIAGGLPKEGGIAGLSAFFPRIVKAYLIGEAAPQFAATLGESVPFEISATLPNAVASAARDASSDAMPSAVLLSPACASFDQYRNFEVRGDAFREAVETLRGQGNEAGQ